MFGSMQPTQQFDYGHGMLTTIIIKHYINNGLVYILLYLLWLFLYSCNHDYHAYKSEVYVFI